MPGLRAQIHRGATEVGGSCVELEADERRILIDLGRPLMANPGDPMELPHVSGLSGHDPSLLGVVITHAHADHYGLMADVTVDVPLFIGEAAERILRESHFFGAAPALPGASGYLADREPIEIGPFTITPFLLDHSAFDSYGLLIESGGRRLFYSGDIRAHGRKARSFERFLAAPPAGIDALLLEGTRLGRVESGGCESEAAVEEAATLAMTASAGLALALYSPQNVDRYVSLFKAARRSCRIFVVDLYGASIAMATGRRTIPQASWRAVRVYVPNSQRVRVKNSGEFERVNALSSKRVHLDEILARPEGFVFPFRASMIRELEAAGVPDATAIWSMWPGYLEQKRSSSLLEFLDRHEISLEIIHASGHASISDLQRFAAGVAPGRVVPIHTTSPDRYGQLFERVEPHADGEWWEV